MKFLPYTVIALSLGVITSAAPAPAPAATPTSATSTPTSTHVCLDMTPSREQPAVAAATAHLEARQSQGSNQGSIPPYVPIVTAAPTQEAALASLGWYQTTYYECHTRDGTEHCGWHIPVQKIKSSGERNRAGWGALLAAAGVVGWVVV